MDEKQKVMLESSEDRSRPNLAKQYLAIHGSCLDEYSGLCSELVDDLIHWLGEDRVSIMYIKPTGWHLTLVLQKGPPSFEEYNWSYHMVAIIDGLVHDAWVPEAMLPPDEYMSAVWSGQDATYEIMN